jgi:hypothetical protein
MATLDDYQKIIKDILKSHAKNNDPDIECQLVFDTENDHYQLLEVGWQGLTRIYACYIHLDIKQGKIWIQQNMTEADLGQELVNRGVPASDIVLGLQPPYKRPYTQYSVA